MEDQLITLGWTILKILMILVPVLLAVMLMTLLERKIIGYMQVRIGPNRVGFAGTLQPIADMVKLLTKELIVPAKANPVMFVIAPVVCVATALAAWSVVPFSPTLVLSNIDAGLLFVFAMTSLGVYGVLMAGWASNSKYAFFGALRSAAQVVSYEIAMGFCFVGVILLAGTTNLAKIVLNQQGGLWHWYFIPLLPLFVIYWISGVAETNRLPFDFAEGEAEIVAGFHVEYSGMGFALFFLGEYANMMMISAIGSICFLGGWLSPFDGIPLLGPFFAHVPGFVWLIAKIFFFMFLFIWLRATFPRYRYDQLMALGWKLLIPFTLIWLLLESFFILYG